MSSFDCKITVNYNQIEKIRQFTEVERSSKTPAGQSTIFFVFRLLKLDHTHEKTRQFTERSDRQKLGRILFAFSCAQPLVKTLSLNLGIVFQKQFQNAMKDY